MLPETPLHRPARSFPRRRRTSIRRRPPRMPCPLQRRPRPSLSRRRRTPSRSAGRRARLRPLSTRRAAAFSSAPCTAPPAQPRARADSGAGSPRAGPSRPSGRSGPPHGAAARGRGSAALSRRPGSAPRRRSRTFSESLAVPFGRSTVRGLVLLLDELRIGRRRLRRRALEALRLLADAVLVVVLLHRLAEALQRASEVAAERLQPLRAEDQHDDQQNDQELPDTDSAESHVQPSWRGSKVINDTPK